MTVEMRKQLPDLIADALRTHSRLFVHAVRPALPAILLYYAVQAVGVAVLVVLSGQAGLPAADLVGMWDGQWLKSVAEGGYNQPIVLDQDGTPSPNNLAFFPLYPALTALVTAVGVPPLKAALLVTVIAGGLLAWGLFALGSQIAGPRVGTLLAGIMAMAPGSGVLHMAYTETVFLALAVWALVALLREQWILAAGLTCLAGLTRVTAVALMAAMAVAAVIATVRGRGGWRPWLAVAVAPLGLLAYLGYVGWRTGRIDGWFWLQRAAWEFSFDAGAFTWERLTVGLTYFQDAWVTLVALLVLAAIALLLWSYATPLPAELYVYSTIVVFMALTGSQHWQSRPRFLLPAIALAIPLALLLARLKHRELAVLLPVGALAGGWFGAYMLATVQLYP